MEPLEPSLQDLLNQQQLKWIFVGGKGGVGKTTVSCCLATLLTKVRDSVLIISTDPAHNLSDAFDQQFSKKPTLVAGFTNLYAMEIDPSLEHDDSDFFSNLGQEGAFMQEMMNSVPGIDEAMSFAEVMRQVQTMEYSVVVFDTAPTGHTLRLLSFPTTLNQGIGRIFSSNSPLSGIFSQLSSMFGQGTGADMGNRMQRTQQVIEEVNKQFKDPEVTTFVCVMIPEFLSLYETERLIQELTRFDIDAQNVVINQVLVPEPGSNCSLCKSRQAMQKKYIDQAEDLYEDFHLVKLPLQPNEIRGVEALKEFSKFLVKPMKGSDGSGS